MTAGDAGERSEAWFRCLFDDHYADRRCFALRRIDNRSAVEDALAETFGIAWRRRALRTTAFKADEDARWRFYVGRKARPGEAPKILAIDGVQNAAAALADHCKGSSRVSQPDGDRWCSSFLRAQVPVDASG
jgi:hypothetical protein